MCVCVCQRTATCSRYSRRMFEPSWTPSSCTLSLRQRDFCRSAYRISRQRLGTDDIPKMELGAVDCSHGRHLEVVEKLWITVGLARDSIGALSEACMTRFVGHLFINAVILFHDHQLVPKRPSQEHAVQAW